MAPIKLTILYTTEILALRICVTKRELLVSRKISVEVDAWLSSLLKYEEFIKLPNKGYKKTEFVYLIKTCDSLHNFLLFSDGFC